MTHQNADQALLDIVAGWVAGLTCSFNLKALYQTAVRLQMSHFFGNLLRKSALCL